MLACGRRCCLCHKFAGGKMECHHIDPAAKGGKNTFENCIPLCFDCHAEAGHYNEKHPKGTKFSPAELLGHRDRWFATIDKGVGPGAPGDYLELDRKLFVRLYGLLGGSKKMIHFRDHDYDNGYDVKVEYRLEDFSHAAGMPECEFFDAEMATALADFLTAISSYNNDFTNRVWYDGDRANIPPEWLYGRKPQEKRFLEAVEVMNKASTKIWLSFAQFVKTARLRLKLELE